jgi:serine/threonine-protein kinase
MNGLGASGGGSGEPRFGDVAIELNLLTPEQVDQLLERQKYFKSLGLPKRIDEIAVEMGMMARIDCDYVLGELHRRREGLAGEAPPAIQGEEDAPLPPCRFGDFELVSRLTTLKGLSYRAFDGKLQIDVGLKLLPRFLSQDRAWVACFQRDVRVAGRLSHPNIIKFHRAGEIDGRFFIALELVEGELLSKRLERTKRLHQWEALRIGREMAYALYHSHVLGLLLRDVRPENIIIEPGGRSRFADLGVGKVQSDDPRLMTCGLAVESPHYQSPEQVRGTMVVGRRSDLYGLGATMYHMLVGHPPFEGTAEEVRMKILSEPPTDPKRILQEIDPHARSLLLKLMDKDPEQRFKRADGVIEMIDRVLGGARVQLTPAGYTPTEFDEVESAMAAEPAPPPKRDGRRSTPVPIPVPKNIAPTPAPRRAAPARSPTPPRPLPRPGTKKSVLRDVEELKPPKPLPGKKPRGKTTRVVEPIKPRGKTSKRIKPVKARKSSQRIKPVKPRKPPGKSKK